LQITSPIKLRALVFRPKERKEQRRNIYIKKRRKEVFCNPSKGKSDEEEKYLSL
jgi:hypothetical protein